ncbi:coiled-coil domain-containing protein 166 [Tachyglossus aculeatus]|uniref:coiled-coil domain-containing protein 166 n=1 Tax=Tachyglossus aculeatus TaxID=9261 RepID=UPI0018F4AC99|nr:coiled-coil domain-containing protein 166 [Tachyglossus aculeatus]
MAFTCFCFLGRKKEIVDSRSWASPAPHLFLSPSHCPFLVPCIGSIRAAVFLPPIPGAEVLKGAFPPTDCRISYSGGLRSSSRRLSLTWRRGEGTRASASPNPNHLPPDPRAPGPGMAPKKKKVAVAGARTVLPWGEAGEPLLAERVQYLQQENAALSEQLRTWLAQVKRMLWENEFLDCEAQRIREENKLFVAYVGMRAHRCQATVVTLDGQYRQELGLLRGQREELEATYRDKEKEVRAQLLDMESRFAQMAREVSELQPYKALQREQQARIRGLERQLLQARLEHTRQMHHIKSRFLETKASRERQARQQIHALARRAEREAVRALIQHTQAIKAENNHLRQELLTLINRARLLYDARQELREQRELLRWESGFGRDLAQAHGWLHRSPRPDVDPPAPPPPARPPPALPGRAVRPPGSRFRPGAWQGGEGGGEDGTLRESALPGR